MKFIIITGSLAIFVIFLVIIICDKIIVNSAKGKLYNSITDIPFNEIGILLGTTKYRAFGPVNPYYRYRIDAAVLLLKTNKIKYIIVSGDNKKNNFHEPEQMRADLVHEGIDDAVIYNDNAGFRTYDSMLRLKEVFSQNKATIISQPFHNERAVYIGQKLNMDVIAFNAKDVDTESGTPTQVREKFARVKVFLDFLIGTKPPSLKNKIRIPA